MEADFRRLCEVVGGVLDEPVPTCPGWTGVDLVRHVTAVYLHKAETIRQGVWPKPWPPVFSGDPLAELAEAYGRLVGELTTRSPDDRALTWYGPDQTVGFWVRRMAQETVVHRFDAEAAAGVPFAPVATDLAEDGIDELLVCFLAYSADEFPEELRDHLAECDGRTIQLATERAGWQLRLGPETITVERGRSDAEAEVSGTADAVLRWVWRRSGEEAVRLDGDRWVIERLRTMLGVATQ